MQVIDKEIAMVADLVGELCGIVLDDSKGYLIESRLGSLAEAHGCNNFAEFCRKARNGDPMLRSRIIDAITTQETLFFRDSSPFEALQHKVDTRTDRRQNPARCFPNASGFGPPPAARARKCTALP